MAFIEQYITGEDENYSIEITSSKQLAQSFTIGNTGGSFSSIIDSVEFKFASASGAGNFQIDIYETDPDGKLTGNSLSTGTISGSVEDGWNRAEMSSYTLQPLIQYAVVIKRAVGSSTLGSLRADGTSPTYSGGSVWFSEDTGETWTEDDTTDFIFSINGGSIEQTLCSIGDVINKAGANANADAISPILITNFIKLAESKFNVLTLFNWTDIYSDLNDDFKFVINDAVSSLAAIYVINFGEADDGFTLESQRKIDNLRVLANEIIREVKDLDVREFMSNVA